MGEPGRQGPCARYTSLVLTAGGLFAATCGVLGLAWTRFVPTGPDETRYYLIAQSIRSFRSLGAPGDEVWNFTFPPGYPALIALVELAAPDPVLAARLASAMATAVTAVVVFLIGRELGGMRAGLVGAGAWIALVPISPAASWVRTEPAAAMWLTLAILAWMRGRRGALWGWAAASAALALAALTRPEILVVLAPFAYSAARSLRPRRLVVAAAPALLILCFYSLSAYVQSGRMGLTHKSYNLALAPVLSAGHSYAEAFDATFRETDPQTQVLRPWAARYLYNLSKVPEAAAATARLVLLLVPAGLIALWRCGHPGRAVPLSALALLLSAPLFWIAPRFVYPALPALCVVAGMANAERTRWRLWGSMAVIVVTLSSSMVSAQVVRRSPDAAVEPAAAEAARDLRSLDGVGAVLNYAAEVSYLAGRPAVWFRPRESVAQGAARARSQGGTHVVLLAQDVPYLGPDWQALWDGESRPELRILRRTDRYLIAELRR